jgi:hypothetical protein
MPLRLDEYKKIQPKKEMLTMPKNQAIFPMPGKAYNPCLEVLWPYRLSDMTA